MHPVGLSSLYVLYYDTTCLCVLS